MEFETEEQQVEALKKWWKENGKQIIFGAVIGFGIIIGWRYYADYSVQQAAQASALFEQVIKSSDAGDNSVDKTAIYNKIKNNYSSTPYLPAVALVVAKSYYAENKKEEAIDVLDSVIVDNKYPIITLIARERKARVLLDLRKADEALQVLDVKEVGSFESIYQELQGDAYVMKGDTEKAISAYDKALLSNQSGTKKILQMKRDSLGRSAVESAA